MYTFDIYLKSLRYKYHNMCSVLLYIGLGICGGICMGLAYYCTIQRRERARIMGLIEHFEKILDKGKHRAEDHRGIVNKIDELKSELMFMDMYKPLGRFE